MDMNNVTLVGRLVGDPEAGTIESGGNTFSKSNFKMAVKRIGTDKTDFIQIEVMGQAADNCNKYLVKGQMVGVEGQLRIDSWQKDGAWNSKTYIRASRVQFGPKPNADNAENSGNREPDPIPF